MRTTLFPLQGGFLDLKRDKVFCDEVGRAILYNIYFSIVSMIMGTLTELLAFRLLLVLRTGVGVLGGVSSVRSIRSSSESSDIFFARYF